MLSQYYSMKKYTSISWYFLCLNGDYVNELAGFSYRHERIWQWNPIVRAKVEEHSDSPTDTGWNVT
jgi:hypothetical protein